MRRLGSERLVIATHNAGKLREIGALLAPYGLECVSAGELGLPEPEETGTTFVENALIKARAAAEGSGLPALADDSGLSVDALGGRPGVYTADWAERQWFEGEPELARPRLVHGDGQGRRHASGAWPRYATAPRSSTACSRSHGPTGQSAVYEGIVRGSLVWPPRGDRGFGYDPVFVPQGHDETFGEMDPEAKHAISHRADAFAKLVAEQFGADLRTPVTLNSFQGPFSSVSLGCV